MFIPDTLTSSFLFFSFFHVLFSSFSLYFLFSSSSSSSSFVFWPFLSLHFLLSFPLFSHQSHETLKITIIQDSSSLTDFQNKTCHGNLNLIFEIFKEYTCISNLYVGHVEWNVKYKEINQFRLTAKKEVKIFQFSNVKTAAMIEKYKVQEI